MFEEIDVGFCDCVVGWCDVGCIYWMRVGFEVVGGCVFLCVVWCVISVVKFWLVLFVMCCCLCDWVGVRVIVVFDSWLFGVLVWRWDVCCCCCLLCLMDWCSFNVFWWDCWVSMGMFWMLCCCILWWWCVFLVCCCWWICFSFCCDSCWCWYWCLLGFLVWMDLGGCLVCCLCCRCVFFCWVLWFSDWVCFLIGCCVWSCGCRGLGCLWLWVGYVNVC